MAPAGESQLLSTNIIRGTYPGSSAALAQSNLRRVIYAEQLAEQLHKDTYAEQLAQTTCIEHMRKALARSNWRRALA